MHDTHTTRRRGRLRARLLASATAVAVVTGLVAVGATSQTAAAADNDKVLEKYAAATWKSFVAMTDPKTGLPADNIAGNLRASTRSGFTSPTNIGSYLWSTVAARDIGLITKAEAKRRMATTLESVAGLERNEQSGMFYNWYDPATGE
jgi:hypothetical protein